MTAIKTVDDFKAYVAAYQAKPIYRAPFGYGFARVEDGAKGTPIKVSIPVINWAGKNAGTFAVVLSVLEKHGVDFSGDEIVVSLTPAILKDIKAIFAPFVKEPEGHDNVKALLAMKDGGHYKLVGLFADVPCKTVETVYLKLLAMSEGHTQPRTLNLTGIFGILPNLAWSGNKSYELDWLRQNKIALQMAGEYPTIDYVDKIPRFLHHVIPADNTRLLDGGKVRMGAHVAAGTTMMPGASYINFNAGTLGSSMVEGRISSSATIGPGTDVGGGASILGVLSGGNSTPISVGATCLLGVNSVCGIPLGDGCIIDAGVSVLAGSKVHLDATQREALAAVNTKPIPAGPVVKGAEFSGLNGLHFRTNSNTGKLVAFRSKFEIKLNKDLH